MMKLKLPRRRFLHLAVGATAPLTLPRFASALDYPTRPVHLVVGFPAGSVSDILARVIGQRLSDHLGRPFVVENRPGASGTLATGTVARSAPDGYTLLLIALSDATSAVLYTNLQYTVVRDITPIASIDRTPYVMVANLKLPPKTLPEFIAYAKANPGKINMGSAGVGSANHIFGELFKMMAEIDLVHVPYRGGAPAITDLISGQIQLMFLPLPASIGYIRSGQLRPFAITTAKRSDVLPAVPTVAEFVPGYEASSWHGIGTPKNTPSGIIAKLHKEIAAGVADPHITAEFGRLGTEPMAMSPTDFGEFIRNEAEKWAKVIKFANIKPE